jgi:hypothetical protein
MKHELMIWVAQKILFTEEVKDISVDQALALCRANGCEYSLNFVDGVHTANVYRHDSIEPEYVQDADETVAVLGALKKVLEKR